MHRVVVFCSTLFVTACGGGDDGPAPDAWVPAGPYHRVVPGYADEPTCRAANPDPLFHCIEALDLCADGRGRAFALFTDIVTVGTWTQSASHVTIEIDSTPELTQDGTVELEVGADGSLFSSEVYGNRAFDRGGDDLCP